MRSLRSNMPVTTGGGGALWVLSTAAHCSLLLLVAKSMAVHPAASVSVAVCAVSHKVDKRDGGQDLETHNKVKNHCRMMPHIVGRK